MIEKKVSIAEDAPQNPRLFDIDSFDLSKLSGDEMARAMLDRLIEMWGKEKALAFIFFGILEQETLGDLLRKDEATVRTWVARREIPFVRLGRRNAFLWESVREWLRQKEFKPRGYS